MTSRNLKWHNRGESESERSTCSLKINAPESDAGSRINAMIWVQQSLQLKLYSCNASFLELGYQLVDATNLSTTDAFGRLGDLERF